jgi:hypothetical protein
MKADRHAVAGRLPCVPAVGRAASAPVRISRSGLVCQDTRFGSPLFVSADNGSASWTEAGPARAIR